MNNLLKVFFILVVLGFNITDTTAAEIPSSKVIGDFHESLLKVMKNARSSNAKARYKQLEPAIDSNYRFEFMLK